MPAAFAQQLTIPRSTVPSSLLTLDFSLSSNELTAILNEHFISSYPNVLVQPIRHDV
jgi:hypothetical protein